MSTTNKEPIWTVRFILVIIMAMFSGLAAQLTYPLVARFSLTLDPDITLAGTIAGLLSDRFSRKCILQEDSRIDHEFHNYPKGTDYELVHVFSVTYPEYPESREVYALMNRFYQAH